jgi:hypothetical protein
VPTLADLQGSIRQAVVLGEASAVAPLLVGGSDVRRRLAIHHRHYETSLVTALLDRFPATIWLVGSTFVTEAARQFVRERPPSKPCIAEYGEDFPVFLSARRGATDLAYLRAFAELEWHLSRLSLAVTLPALSQADLSALDPDTLADVRITMQPGVHYFHAAWAVDDLIRLHLTDSAPDRFELRDGDVWLELRGARGELQMNRLDRATFTFRVALCDGRTLGDAASSALDLDAAFDAGQALAVLITDGLVTATGAPVVSGFSRTGCNDGAA